MSPSPTENLLAPSRLSLPLPLRPPRLQDVETLALPSREQGIKFSEFIEQATAKPQLYLRNSAGFIVQAMEASGFFKEYHYGRMIQVFNAMCPESSRTGYPQSKVPRDHEETIFELHTILKELAKLPIPNKGVLLYGPPGCGKNLIIDLMLHITEEYSRYHPDGARFRLALKFDRQRFVGFGQPHSLNGNGNGNGSGHGGESHDDYIITSPSNTTPFSLLNFEIDQARHSGSHPLFQQYLQEREDLLDRLAANAGDDTLNTDYAREARLGPSLKVVCEGLLDHYMRHEKYSFPDALKAIRENHVVAQPYFFDSELGDGILSKIPLGESASDAWGLHGSFGGGGEVPDTLREVRREPLIISSAQLRTDVQHLEDVFHPRMDLGHMTYLHSLIEKGQLQIPTADPDGNSRMPTRFVTVTGKDWQLLASANTQNIHNRSGEEGFAPLAERFIGLNVSHIRNYKKQAESLRPILLSLSDGRQATPHAVEVASLFFVATRLIDPKPSYYTGDFKDASELVSGLKGGVTKALYLALTPGQGEEHVLNFISGHFSGEQLKVLMRPDIRYRIAHEHTSSRRIGATATLTDGGFGISPRLAHSDVFTEMINYNPDSDFTLRDVVDFLKTREGNFPYYSALRETRSKIQKQLYVEECDRRNITPIDLADIEAASLSAKEEDQVKAAWAAAVKATNERFPIAEPKNIVAELEVYAKALMRDDVLAGLGLTDRSSRDRLTRYIMHTVSYLLRDREVPDEYRNVKKDFSDKASNHDKRGVDEKFMRSVEEEFDVPETRKDEFRRDIMGAFSAGSMDCRKRAEEANQPAPTTEELFSELFVTKESLASKLNTLKIKVAAEAAPKLQSFLDNIPRYHQQPERLDADLKDPGRREGAEQWKAAWSHLTAIGYTESVLPNLAIWALQVKSEESTSKNLSGNR